MIKHAKSVKNKNQILKNIPPRKRKEKNRAAGGLHAY